MARLLFVQFQGDPVTGDDRRVWLAKIVEEANRASPETHELIENVARNWGKKVKVFSRLENAIAWLEKNFGQPRDAGNQIQGQEHR